MAFNWFKPNWGMMAFPDEYAELMQRCDAARDDHVRRFYEKALRAEWLRRYGYMYLGADAERV